MNQFKDITGQKFGRLTAIKRNGSKNGITIWECKCECGNVLNVYRTSLISGHTKSCGCLRRDVSKSQHTTHGMSKTKTHYIWNSMKDRCNCVNDKSYYNYGGRGIKVCDRWDKFENFLADMGECPDGMSIDRIDNDGDYTPENCKWSTAKEQANNTRHNHLLTYNGKTQTISQWSDEIGMSYKVLNGRIYNGWAIEDALEIPVGGVDY